MPAAESGRIPLPESVLVTGGAGFLGSHLAEALLARGCAVTVLDDLSTGRCENLAHLEGQGRFRFVRGSALDEAALDELAAESPLIIHLAAVVGVRLIVEQPVRAIETNVLGARAVLQAALRRGCRVLLASSSEVYGKGGAAPLREQGPTRLGPAGSPRWAYAASKLAAEHLGLAYHRQLGLPLAIFRPFNLIGPRQLGRYGMVVPRFVEQALAGRPLTVYGDGRQRRCFLHVADSVEAILALAERPQALGRVVNIGSQEEISMLGLARLVLELVDACRGGGDGQSPAQGRAGGTDERVTFVPYEQAYAGDFDDVPRRVPDLALIRRLTGWQPRRPLRAALQDVIASFPGERGEPDAGR